MCLFNLADCQIYLLLFLPQGGGLDKLTLDSLYGDGAYRQMQKQKQLPYGSAPQNPFMVNISCLHSYYEYFLQSTPNMNILRLMLY
jgi:hypothetical protein